MEAEWSTFLLGERKKKRKRAAKKPREPPLVPDMQAKLAERKETEKKCKWGCVRQSTEGPEMAPFLSAWWRNHLFSLNLGQDNENRDSGCRAAETGLASISQL